MAKVFTITQGLENMGAMKTGGQGSVYKGRRVGEIITAIKLLPTPIYNESVEDKNYRDFQNEVQKLKEVNKVPNPNVVKILSSGLTETGNFPFIEMEYIDGPDLEELLAPPLEPLFTIKETIKVAEQLSNALAHCHRHDVKHGDIKSNNIKLNLNTGNYVLLDFGLAIMNDEQRRTSLRKAGAVEFMAPEQDNGQMLFQTDVYGFGVVMYELLAGRVPFPLEDKSESARNNVRLAHMETLPPDILTLRSSSLPGTWSKEKREREMQVPDWLITLAYTCLRKKPETRFANGIELHDFIVYHATQLLSSDKMASPILSKVNSDVEKEQLRQQVTQFKQQVMLLQREIETLKTGSTTKNTFTNPIAGPYNNSSKFGTTNAASQSAVDLSLGYDGAPKGKQSSQTWFVVLLFTILALAIFAGYKMFYKNDGNSSLQNPDTTASSTTDTAGLLQPGAVVEGPVDKHQQDLLRQRKADSLKAVQAARLATQRSRDSFAKLKNDTTTNNPPSIGVSDRKLINGVQYMVVSKAYFYTAADEATRRNVYVEPANNAIVNAEEEQGDFIFVTFTNTKGQPSRGWLRKKDLQQVSD